MEQKSADCSISFKILLSFSIGNLAQISEQSYFLDVIKDFEHE